MDRVQQAILLPHGYCISWQPELLAAMVAGNLLIALSYFAIPIIIVRFLRQRKDVDFKYLHWLFAAFIISCGASHFLHMVGFWYPVYYLEAATDVLTALISLTSAVLLWKLFPVLVNWPSISQLRAANQELQKLGAELQEREMQLRSLGDSLPDSYLYQYTVEDGKPKFLYVSSGVERLNGVKPGLVMQDAMLLMDQVEPAQREAYAEAQETSLRGLSDFSMELHMRRPDGEWRWLHVKSRPRRKSDGQVIWDGIATDFTDRHLFETEINRLAQAIEQNPTGILITAADGMLEYMNEACGRISGYQFADAYGRKLTPRGMLLAEMSDAEYGEVQARLQSGKTWSGTLRNRRRNGNEYWEQITVAPIYGDDGKVASHLYLFADVTEKKNVEEALREASVYNRSLIEASLDPLVTISPEGKITDVNKATETATGIGRAELIGTDFSDYFTEPDKARRGYQQVFAEGSVTGYSLALRHRDGRITEVLYNAGVYRNEAGEVMGVFAAARDITELKKAEVRIGELNRDLERRVVERTAQLEEANKELEAFSYSVSHDLRAPLRAIDGFSHILLEEYGDNLDEEGKHQLDVVRENAVRMGQLIDDILHFSRSGRAEMNRGKIDMAALAREVLDELLRNDPQPALQVEIGGLPQAVGDRAMLKQVYANLLSNALKFSHNREAPRVAIGGRIEGNEAVYYVKDNGAGFDMQYADRLFGVFQRLHSKSEFDGTGIGLAIVKRIVSRHGGRVWAESRPGEGAMFCFALPLMSGGKGRDTEGAGDPAGSAAP